MFDLMRLDEYRKALDACSDVLKAKDLLAEVETVRAFCKTQNDRAGQGVASEAVVRAQRRCGELFLAEAKPRSDIKLPPKADLQKLRDSGMSLQAIADKFGVAPSTVRKALLRSPTTFRKVLCNPYKYGVSHQQARAWSRLSEIPSTGFESILKDFAEDEHIPSAKGVTAVAESRNLFPEQAEKKAAREKRSKAATKGEATADRNRRAEHRQWEEDMKDPEKKAAYERKVDEDHDRRARVMNGVLGRMSRDCFEAFCRGVSFESLKKAYLAECEVLHPDRGGDNEAMTKLNGLWKDVKKALGK